jgi:ribosomal protein S18 acetylase RimI-like enzyme
MLVRARLDEDLAGCVQALAAVHAADGYPACWPADPVEWLNPSGPTAAWVVEQAGVIAGHIGMVRGVDDPALTGLTGVPAHRLASVTRLFVAPPARGRRVGTRLMHEASVYAREQGLQLVLDVVDDGGPAVSLYDRLGWRVVDHRLADWITPDGRRPPIRIHVAPDQPSSVP